MTDLEDLIGLHELSGVDTVTIPLDPDKDRYEAAQAMSFVLDGVVYTATEDPSDGYRSYLGSLDVGGEVSNRFPPQRMLCTYEGKDGLQKNEILVMTDVITAKEVLRVGTANTNDYYPLFVADFDPTAMACNAPGTKDEQRS